MSRIGDKIREARKQRGITQMQLSSGLVTRSMMSQIESGKARPSYQLLKSLTERLGLEIHDLMDDTDLHLQTAAYLKLMDYYITVDALRDAEKIIKKIERPATEGPLLYEYLRLKSAFYRKTGNFQAALADIKELRENAYQSQDTYLQMQVHQESGYLEYAMNKPEDAITEWKKAVVLGERFLSGTPLGVAASLVGVSSVCYQVLDMCLFLARILRIQGRLQEATEYLAKAEQLSDGLSDLRQISTSYAIEAESLLETGEPRRAQHLVNEAIAILRATKTAQHTILAKEYRLAWTPVDSLADHDGSVGHDATRARKADHAADDNDRMTYHDGPVDHDSSIDQGSPSGRGALPSDHQLQLERIEPDILAAHAITEAHPVLTVEAEIAYIQTLMNHGRFDDARLRVQALSERLAVSDHTTASSPEFTRWKRVTGIQLTTLAASLYAEAGDVDTALMTMDPLLDAMADMTDHQIRRMFNSLLEWSEGKENTEEEKRITHALETWMESKSRRT